MQDDVARDNWERAQPFVKSAVDLERARQDQQLKFLASSVEYWQNKYNQLNAAFAEYVEHARPVVLRRDSLPLVYEVYRDQTGQYSTVDKAGYDAWDGPKRISITLESQ